MTPEDLTGAQSCITCGDVAVELTVLELSVDSGGVGRDARCRADDGSQELVAIDLVDGVFVGDRLLVHARTALEVVNSSVRKG